MFTRRDRSLIGGGVLIGIGAGICVGVCLFILSIFSLLHHMFIVEIHWLSIAILISVPVLFILGGLGLLSRSRRTL